MDYIGWLTPKAELIKCNAYGHLDTARCLVKEFGYPVNDKSFDDVLLENGWIRISMQTFYDKGIYDLVTQTYHRLSARLS